MPENKKLFWTVTEAKMNEKRSVHDHTGYGAPRNDRVYCSVIYADGNAETVLDQLENRFYRPYKDWKPLVKKVLKNKFGIEPERIAWSSKAGCTCHCSPGFVLIGPGMDNCQTFWLTMRATLVDLKSENKKVA
jgi:hypothetical protein